MKIHKKDVIYLLNGIYGSTRCNFFIYLANALCENFSVLGLYNRFDRCPQNFNVVLREHTIFLKLHAAIKGSLSAECQQYAVRPLRSYYLNQRR